MTQAALATLLSPVSHIRSLLGMHDIWRFSDLETMLTISQGQETPCFCVSFKIEWVESTADHSVARTGYNSATGGNIYMEPILSLLVL